MGDREWRVGLDEFGRGRGRGRRNGAGSRGKRGGEETWLATESRRGKLGGGGWNQEGTRGGGDGGEVGRREEEAGDGELAGGKLTKGNLVEG